MKTKMMAVVLAVSAAGLGPAADAGAAGREPGPPSGLARVEGQHADPLTRPDDLAGLRLSHYSEVSRWHGVLPMESGDERPDTAGAWRVVEVSEMPPRRFVAPFRKGQAWTLIRLPEFAEYRVWLGYRAEPGKPRPVTLTLAGSNQARHVFGRLNLGEGESLDGETTLPVRREREADRATPSTGPLMLWEYADLSLNAGTTRFALEAEDPAVRVDGVFLTACRTASFGPQKSPLPRQGTLYRTWCRLRVISTDGDDRSYQVPRVELIYHWRRIQRGSDAPLWYSHLGRADGTGFTGEDGASTLPVGDWTRWVEVTEEVMDGPWARGGYPWATAGVKFGLVNAGACEVQWAWFPHESAVLRTVRTGIAGGQAVCLIPVEPLSQGPVSDIEDAEGVWGMRAPDVLSRFEGAEEAHRRHLAWGREAVARSGQPGDHPLPRRLRLWTFCQPVASWRPHVQRMLAALGINDMGPLEASLQQDLGLPDSTVFIAALDSEYLARTHDPLDPAAERNFEASLRRQAETLPKGSAAAPPLVRIKMGDEIERKGNEAKINGLETARRAFHDYLRERIEKLGTNAAYYGATDLEDLRYLEQLPDRPSLAERRLYYDSQRFAFVYTALYYAQITRAAERVFPRVQTYCNFSPHPPMIHQHMNDSDWFALTRHGGATMAWGECWASGDGGWGFTGFDVVSYYAAWVECAARVGRGFPAGFYIVGTMGGFDRKLFSLLPRGIFYPMAYSWGPLYAGVEASNFWSENPDVYALVARAARALGPAETIVLQGRREPRRVALLYNRTHEIWNGGAGGFQTDRLLQFLALSHAHIPAEIILEEDCTDAGLAPYRVVHIQGHHIEARAFAALRRWVEAGGVLVGGAGTAMRDESDTPLGDADVLWGARQRLAGSSRGSWHPQSLPDHAPVDTVRLLAGDLTPALTAAVIGVQARLTPTTGRPVGFFSDGACAAVEHEVGKGRTLLLGIQPGILYKGSARGGSRYRLERRPLVTQPAESILGPQRVTYSEPQTEVAVFESDEGLAVTLNNFAFFLEPAERPVVLTVQTDRPIREVLSTLRGPQRWRRESDRIRVDMTAPETVDVILLR